MAIKVINENSFQKSKNQNREREWKRDNKYFSDKNPKETEKEGDTKNKINSNPYYKNKGKFNQRDRTECWHCGVVGHYRSDCPKISKEKGENRN